jgi:periplasmic protein TonB
MKYPSRLLVAATGAAAAVAAVLLTACSYLRLPTSAPVSSAASVAPPSPAPTTPHSVGRTSTANNVGAYRTDAASHLYGLNRDRIYAGKMPPMLYAVGVLQVDVDSGGNVRSLRWMRAPSHAPEVVAEIERTVRSASPFPAPSRLGKVVYTDTWLWDRSGRFQLHTLTEGQL